MDKEVKEKYKDSVVNTPTVQCETYSQNDLVVLSAEELNYKNYQIAYHEEREEMAKTAMFTLRQDTVNEIVELLKEKDYNELADLIKTEFSVKARKYTVESLIAKARKEEVEKFAKMVYATLTNRTVWVEMHNWWLEGKECYPLKNLLNELVKQFSTEIKE